MSKTENKVFRLAGIGILTAIIIVLQVVTTYFPTKPFAITLALVPIFIGSAVFDEKVGAFLGGVFSAVALVMSIIGADIGGAMMWAANPFLCTLVCMLKGSCAGYVAGLIYKILGKKNTILGTLAAGIAAPVVNTGILVLGASIFFRPVLAAWAGNSDILYYVICGLIGVNFLLELGVNIVLSPVIVRILKALKIS